MGKQIDIDIRRLGPLKDMHITLRPLTVFTGESGLGKSYAALVCYYLFDILSGDRIQTYFTQQGIDIRQCWDNPDEEGVVLTIESADLLRWLDEDVVRYVAYMTGNPDIVGEVHFNLELETKTYVFRRGETVQKDGDVDLRMSQLSCNDSQFTSQYGHMLISDVIFAALLSNSLAKDVIKDDIVAMIRSIILPPSRGALMDCVSRPKFKAGIYDKFYDFKERLLSNYYIDFKGDNTVKALIRDVAGGSLEMKEGEVWFGWDDENRIPLSAAASSVKELAPYLLWLNSSMMIGTGLLFEEPEAHLHPSRQKRVADTFSYLMNMRCWMVVTTHSDYLLKRINQLGRLYSLRLEHYKEVCDVMERHDLSWESLIDLSEVAAYHLVANGDGTTRAERIDSPEGIAFSSFEKVIDSEIDLSADIEILLG